MVTRVDGKVVAEARPPSQISDAMGFFVVGPQGHRGSTFPFQIDPRKVPQPGRKAEPRVRSLKNRFGKEVPDEYFDFDDRDAVTDRCINLAPADLVGLGKLLQIQSGTFCIVFWRGNPSGSMLIGVALADGDPWMRPFSRRICRWLMSAALTRMAATDREPPPDYAACLLVDRPDRSGAAETLETYVFEVRRDNEPMHVAEATAKLGLAHVVVTSVDRDDLDDGGAGHFAEVIRAIRAQCPATTIEVLTPDFLRKTGRRGNGGRGPARRIQPQSRNRAVEISHGAAGRALLRLDPAAAAGQGDRSGDVHQVRNHGRARRRAQRSAPGDG